MQEKKLLCKEVAETREKMEDVLPDFLSELRAKHEQTLNLMDDEFCHMRFYNKRKAAYLSARALVPSKINLPCFCRELGW